MKNLYDRLIRHNGNQDLFRVVEMSVVALLHEHPFHIQAEGLRGTGKTTIMRAARDLLPPIIRIKGCLYNCHPLTPHCPFHRNLSPDEIAMLGTEEIPRPFLEISQAAKLGTVIGSIDLAKLTNPANPLAALLPGTIPQAHRGIIFIDEINRLADTSPELADVLLDVMGTRPGRVQIEEPGLPVVELPVTVSIWAASNPDEEPGPLSRIRKQLADRFDVTVTMGRPDSCQEVIDILTGDKRVQAVEKDFSQYSGKLADIEVSSELRQILGKIYLEFGLESLRSVAAMETAACLAAVLAGSSTVGIAELKQVVPLALAHRVSTDTMTAILAYLNSLSDGQSPQVAVNGNNENRALPVISRWASRWLNCKARLAALLQRLPVLSDLGVGGSGKGGRGSAQIVDPLKTTIIAPPKPALPIAQLPDDQLVTRETK